MKQLDDGPLDKIENWCRDDIDAHGEVHRSEGEIECVIQNRRYDVWVSIDEDNNGKVLLDDKYKDNDERMGYNQDWEGDVQELDLHDNGLTAISDRSTFSINWGPE